MIQPNHVQYICVVLWWCYQCVKLDIKTYDVDIYTAGLSVKY